MHRSTRPKPRTSKGLRWSVCLGLLVIAYQFSGLGFSVNGSWDGTIEDAKAFPKGLAPLVSGLAFGEETDNGLVNIAVEDGHLVVNYADGPWSLRADDDQSWQANFTKPDTALRVSGRAADDLKWDISKHSDVKGVGAVDVNVSNGHRFGIAVEPSLVRQGTRLRALARSHGGDVQARLETQQKLVDGVDFGYGVENEMGNYELEGLAHDAHLQAKLGSDSEAILSMAGGRHSQVYNATFKQNVGRFIRGDGEAVVGADNDGVYGAFSGSRPVARGVQGQYRLAGRLANRDADPTVSQALKLAHELGSLTFSQASGGPVSATVESDVSRGPLRAQGRLRQTFDDEIAAPTYNLTLTRDLSNLPAVDGEIQVGVDDASLDGVYGHLTARRNFGKGASMEYTSEGRAKNLAHSVKLTNDLGYARVVKRTDSSPRLQLGYQFNA